MRKYILIALAVVVVAIAGALYYAYSNLDSIAKDVMEKAGSEAPGRAGARRRRAHRTEPGKGHG